MAEPNVRPQPHPADWAEYHAWMDDPREGVDLCDDCDENVHNCVCPEECDGCGEETWDCRCGTHC